MCSDERKVFIDYEFRTERSVYGIRYHVDAVQRCPWCMYELARQDGVVRVHCPNCGKAVRFEED